MVVAEYYIEDLERTTRMKKEQIIEGLTNLGAPSVESEDGQKIIVELTPNRVDLLHPAGVARALLCYYGKRKPGTYEALPSKYELIVDAGVNKLRPYTAWAVARGLDFSGRNLEYLIQFQEKLDATMGRKVKKAGIGFYPMEKLLFPIRYTAMKPKDIVYQPLNYPTAASAREILEKHPKGREYGWILQGFEQYPVFLDAKGNVLCLIPICNAKEYGEVTEKTTEVAIEVTGTDLNTVLALLDIISCNLADSGARIYKVKMRYPEKSFAAPVLQTRKMVLKPEEVQKILGVSFTAAQIRGLLERMDIRWANSTAVAPPYRSDVMHAVDVVEDVAIAYGYNTFQPTLPDFFSEGKRGEEDRRWRRILQGMGFQEIRNFVLTSPSRLKQYGNEPPVRVLNPVSEDVATLQPSALPGLLETFHQNRVKGLPQRIYEIAQTHGGKTLVVGVMDKEVPFPVLRGVLQTLIKEWGWGLEIRPLEGPPALLEDTGRGEIWINGKKRGRLGKVRPDFLERLRLEFEVGILEIGL